MSAPEKLAHLFERWDRVKSEFLEDRARERTVLDVIRDIDHSDESRPE